MVWEEPSGRDTVVVVVVWDVTVKLVPVGKSLYW